MFFKFWPPNKYLHFYTPPTEKNGNEYEKKTDAPMKIGIKMLQTIWKTPS
jgi:hypothetical protein